MTYSEADLQRDLSKLKRARIPSGPTFSCQALLYALRHLHTIAAEQGKTLEDIRGEEIVASFVREAEPFKLPAQKKPRRRVTHDY